MPNWCMTGITITSNGKLKKCFDEMQEALSSNPANAGFGNEWLGNLLLHIGMDEDEVVCGDIRCRGYVCDLTYDSGEACDEIVMHTESAWCPATKAIMMFVDKYCDDYEFLYWADEPGNGLYCSNDPSIAGKVSIDFYGSNEHENEYDLDDSIANAYLSDLTGKSGTTEELIEAFNESDAGYAYIVSYKDPREW